MSAISMRLFVIAFTSCLACRVVAAEPDNDSKEPADSAGRDIAAAIRIDVVGQGGGPAELLSEPALRFGDPARDNGQGTLWIWMHDGRPASLMEMYFNTQTESRIQVVASLTGAKLDATGGDGFVWRPASAGVEFQSIDGSPPADRADVRLRQMKLLARRFKAHQFWDPDHSRYELRLMPRPAARYDAPGSGVLDGALFLFAHGTNPEIALLLEAERSAQGERWRFAAARIGHAEMHLSFDDREVWRTDRLDVTEPEDPYHLFFYNAPDR